MKGLRRREALASSQNLILSIERILFEYGKLGKLEVSTPSKPILPTKFKLGLTYPIQAATKYISDIYCDEIPIQLTYIKPLYSGRMYNPRLLHKLAATATKLANLRERLNSPWYAPDSLAY